MKLILLIAGVLLYGAPLCAQIPPGADPVVKDGAVSWPLLHETLAQVTLRLGRPRLTAEFGDFVSLQYQFAVADAHEYSHILVFRKLTGALVSVTRNYDPPRSVNEFFPPKETVIREYKDQQTSHTLRVRQLAGAFLLLASRHDDATRPVNDLTAIRISELESFYPWLAAEFSESKR